MDPPLAIHKAIDAHSLEDILACTKPQEKKVRPQQEQPLKCPRCDSTNTKFCYYNNYSLSQPRYFCKGCKRYWTQGGALRNVPVGGGCRKNKRPSTTTSSSTAAAASSLSAKTTQDQFFIHTNANRIPTLPLLTYDPNDLTLVGFNGHDTNTISFDDILGIPKSSFLDTQSAIPYNYNGVGSDDMGEVVSDPYEEMRGLKAAKLEVCGGRDGDIDRRFWNFPWQSGAEASLGGLDSGREYWNGFESSWKGLINSTLM